DLLGAVETPHQETRVQKSSLREQVVQTLHGMEAIDRLFALPVATVVRAVFDLAFLQQAQALYAQIESRLGNLIWSPHSHRHFGIDGQLERAGKIETFSGPRRALVPIRHDHSAEAVKHAKVWILREIGGQPADGKSLEVAPLVFDLLESRGPLGRRSIGVDANHGYEGVR